MIKKITQSLINLFGFKIVKLKIKIYREFDEILKKVLNNLKKIYWTSLKKNPK